MAFATPVILKSDQEPAIVDVLNEIARMRGEGRTIIEHSPVAESQANGFVERAIQTVEKILRTHLLASEDKVKAKISVGHPIFAWLVEYSADLYNRYQLGRHGEDRDAEVEGEALYSALRGVRTAHHVPGRWKSTRWHDERTVDVWIVPWEASRLGGEPGDDRRRQGGQSKSH